MKEKENISLDDFERIEAYLLNKLPEKERFTFREEMSGKPALKQEVEIQRELMLAVETGEMKNRLNTIHQKVISKISLTRWLAVAASVTILVAVGIWMINKPDKTEQLFAANLTIEPGLPVPMSATNNYDFYDAMVDYKSGKYELAISKWEPILNANPGNDTLIYFVGVAKFNLENYQEAIPYFEKVTQLNTSSFYSKGEWYLALSYLIQKDFDGLKSLASESQSDYADRIKQLNQKLE